MNSLYKYHGRDVFAKKSADILSFRISFITISNKREKHPEYNLCSFCDKMFIQTCKLRSHLINEHDAKCGAKDFYVCWKCKKCCSSFKDLDEHLTSEHEMNKHEHRCQLCQDETFSSRVTLKMHVLKFHEIDFSKVSNTPFIHKLFNIITEPNVKTIDGAGVPCPVCQKKFASNRSLSDHRRQVHEKANHVKCDHCSYSSFQPYLLKKHIERQHTTTNEYKCDQCSYSTYSLQYIGKIPFKIFFAKLGINQIFCKYVCTPTGTHSICGPNLKLMK